MRDKIKGLFEDNDSNVKAYAFFIFYIILFIVIIYFLRNASKRSVDPSLYEKGGSLTYDADIIKNNNYAYNYKIVVDDVVYEYNGKRKGNTELFTYNGKEYYKNNDSYFVNEGEWVKGNNPYIYSEFLDIQNIITILDASFYNSKTIDYNNKVSYNVLISTNTINQLIKNINSDFLEEPNSINVYVNNSDVLTGVSMNLDSYCKLNKLCQKSLKINILYDNVGEIDNIKNPVNM